MFASTRALCARSAKQMAQMPHKAISSSTPITTSPPAASVDSKPSKPRPPPTPKKIRPPPTITPTPTPVPYVPPKPQILPILSTSTNSKWLDDLELKMKLLRSQDIKPKDAGKLAKRLKKIQDSRLELLSGREGYLLDARSRGVDKQAVAWGEMDGMVSHVNNVHYNRWAESGRINWLNDFAKTAESELKPDWRTLLTPRGIGVILKSVKTEFKFPVSCPDQISVIHKITTKVDSSSSAFSLESIIFSEHNQRIAARTTEEIVIYDYLVGSKTTLKPFMVEALAHMYELQERRRIAVENDIREITEDIKDLEEWLVVSTRRKIALTEQRQREDLEELGGQKQLLRDEEEFRKKPGEK